MELLAMTAIQVVIKKRPDWSDPQQLDGSGGGDWA